MKELIYEQQKKFTEEGEVYQIRIRVRLDDACENKHCDFSITGDIWKGEGKLTDYNWEQGGCIHDDILEHFPELGNVFVPLHLSSHTGAPMYPVGNGIYWLKENEKTAKEYLRITGKELITLKEVAKWNDSNYFTYMLYELGIVDRWKEEADYAIAYLEKLTNEKWENPYTPEQERFNLPEKPNIDISIYTKENLRKKISREKKEAKEKKLLEIESRYEKKSKILLMEKKIAIAMAEINPLKKNYLYYDHDNSIEINLWKFEDFYTKEEIEKIKKIVEKYNLKLR